MYSGISKLKDEIIKEIWADEYNLCFITNDKVLNYTVEGDCCSRSFFHDFIGVKKLLDGNPIISAKEIYDSPVEPTQEELDYADVLQCYGVELVTDSPDFGEVTSVFSFRNDSNGYYGGWINEPSSEKPTGLIQITDDVLDIPNLEGGSDE